MSSSIAERIAARLKDLQKNPSAVALEAGLGRSSVRDILVGKVASPRMDTLEKLTGPLECSLEYLTGRQDVAVPARREPEPTSSAWYDPIEIVEPARLEVGVYRTDEALGIPTDVYNPPDREYPISKRHLYYNDLRLPEHFFNMYEMGDASLSEMHILPGDMLTAAAPYSGTVPVKRGTIVVVRRLLSSAEELSARYVDIIDGNIVLTSRSSDPKFKPIPIVDTPGTEELDRQTEEMLPNTYFTEQGSVTIEGVVVRVTRKMSI